MNNKMMWFKCITQIGRMKQSNTPWTRKSIPENVFLLHTWKLHFHVKQNKRASMACIMEIEHNSDTKKLENLMTECIKIRKGNFKSKE